MTDLYNILSIFATSGLLLALGLMLLFTASAGSPLLGNYRRARYAIAGAYLFFAALNVVEYICEDPSVQSVTLMRTITLAIAASQAFLFTFAMLALLETRFPGWRAIFREAIPVILLIVAVFIVYALCSEACFNVAFEAFVGIYALLLARYSYLFFRNYRRFRRRMDNYFSGNEADRMRWVAFSFFAALGIGIGALATSVFMSTAVALGFTVIFDIFYTYFAIRFINYAYRFHAIETAMENNDTPESIEQPREDKNILPPTVVKTIETNIKGWTEGKQFLAPGITLGDLSQTIGTNDKYLSLYINRSKGKTFREWINGLRIEEAQHLMRDDPDMPLAEIARRTGFTSQSHFGQQFRTVTGSSPFVWRMQNFRSR